MPDRRLGAVASFLALVLGCAALIAATAALTESRIDENRARHFQQALTDLTGSARLAAEVSWQGDTAFLCNGQALLRGAAAGYGGDIHWLALAAPADRPELTRASITAHQETPGIADFLDTPDRGWLASLYGRDAAAISATDGVSGATVTSRAVKRSLAAALERPALTTPRCPP